MSQARTEYAIVLSVIGILLAIGIPSLQRGELTKGWLCLGFAAVVIIWQIVIIFRARK